VLRLPEDHVYVALLSNDETADIQPEIVANRLAAIAIGKPMAAAKTVRFSQRVLETFAGEYQKDADNRLTVRRDGERLFAQSPGDPEFEIFPVSDLAFIVGAFDARVTFVKDTRGRVTGLIESFGGQDTELKKIK
jgi:D-alanyl-D-alanine carboxypeptidase